MAIPASRAELKQYMLRMLGSPVIQINVADVQIEDVIDDVLSFMQDYHHDFSQRVYIAHQLTANDISTKQIELDPSILQATRVWKITGEGVSSSEELFNINYQLRLNDLWSLSSVNLSGYVISREYLGLIDDILNSKPLTRFSRYASALYLDTDASLLTEGSYIIIEAWVANLPGEMPRLWGDRTFRKLCTAHLKKIWGTNMSKFQSIQLPGGVTLNGGEIVQQAESEITALETDFQLKYQEPEGIFVG